MSQSLNITIIESLIILILLKTEVINIKLIMIRLLHFTIIYSPMINYFHCISMVKTMP